MHNPSEKATKTLFIFDDFQSKDQPLLRDF